MLRSKGVINLANVSWSIFGRRCMSSDVRNIGIMAHIDAGKTTTTERMLYLCGETRRIGSVDTGTTVTDYLPSERNRGITVQSAAVTMHWDDSTLNLIDTPGHVDFTVEVERALHVLDGCVAVFDGSKGVEAQTKTVWKQANNMNIPRIAFINKMDNPRANYAASISSIEEKLNATTCITQIPIWNEKKFNSIIDVVDLEVYNWKMDAENDGTKFTCEPLTQNNNEDWKHALIIREKIIETLSDIYDEMANLWLNEYAEKPDVFPSSILQKYLKLATVNNKVVPILCGSAFTNVGIQPLMNAVVDYLPSPDEVENNELVKYEFPKDMLIAYAFKVLHDKKGTPMVYARIYSGRLSSKTDVYNATKDKKEANITLFKVFGNEFHPVKNIHDGQIVAISGLKHTGTGDVIVENKNYLSKIHTKSRDETSIDTHAILSPVTIHEPVFFCSVEVNSLTEQTALENALNIICKEDPSVHAFTEHEFGQKIISGMGELHIEVILERLTQEFKLNCYTGPIKVAYRERPTEALNVIESYEREVGGKTYTVDVSMDLKPVNNFRKVHSVISNNIDPNLKQQINKGIKHACYAGPIMRYPIVGVEIGVSEIQLTTKAPAMVVTAAISTITKQLLSQSYCDLLEPVMKVEIITTPNYVDAVLGSLAQRRATVTDCNSEKNEYIIIATAPVAEMLGYSKQLRTRTSGNADLSLHVQGYSVVDENEIEVLKSKQI